MRFPTGVESHHSLLGAAMTMAPTGDNQANPDALNAIVKASETYSIVASQDIVDVQGLKLWAKGQPVSSALQQRLLDRKLRYPLEACLAAEDGVTSFSLHADLLACLNTDAPLARALRPWAPVLLEQVKQLPLHSVAQLLLTAAMATRPSSLPHALESMMLAGAMASGPGLSSSVNVRMAMLGGLLHDIGEVYIQPEYLTSKAPLDLMGHKHLMVHPRVAQMLLSKTTDYPQTLCRAIGEHHERLDGSGYPARLLEPGISSLGRLLAVVELTMGILRTPRAPLTRADFALRVVPGEYDPAWSSFICNLARAVPANPTTTPAQPAFSEGSPLQQIDERTARAQQLALILKAQGRAGPVLEIVDTALIRLNRLRQAWNALGFWGANPHDLSPPELFELELAGHELQQRLTQLQRECLLLGERLGELEKMWLEPLWRGIAI